MEGELYKIANEHGYHVNSKNVPYKDGASYNLAKKMKVAAAIQACQAGNMSEHPNIRFVSCACKVSSFFEENCQGAPTTWQGADPRRNKEEQQIWTRCKELDEIDAFVVLLLYMEEPSWGLHTHALWLEHFTGMPVSDSFNSRFFDNAFPISVGLYCPNLSPFDKFCPKNCI